MVNTVLFLKLSLYIILNKITVKRPGTFWKGLPEATDGRPGGAGPWREWGGGRAMGAFIPSEVAGTVNWRSLPLSLQSRCSGHRRTESFGCWPRATAGQDWAGLGPWQTGRTPHALFFLFRNTLLRLGLVRMFCTHLKCIVRSRSHMHAHETLSPAIKIETVTHKFSRVSFF